VCTAASIASHRAPDRRGSSRCRGCRQGDGAAGWARQPHRGRSSWLWSGRSSDPSRFDNNM